MLREAKAIKRLQPAKVAIIPSNPARHRRVVVSGTIMALISLISLSMDVDLKFLRIKDQSYIQVLLHV